MIISSKHSILEKYPGYKDAEMPLKKIRDKEKRR
jgi:hypothetical protein